MYITANNGKHSDKWDAKQLIKF